MNNIQLELKEWGVVILTFFESLLRKVGAYVPNILGAIVLIIIGLITARLFRRITVKILILFRINTLSEKVNFNEFLKKLGIDRRIENIIASFVYFIVMLFFVVSTSEIIGLKVVLETMNKFIAYLPHILGAFIILFISFFVASFVKNATESLLSNFNIGYAKIVSSTLEIIIIIFGILMALNELGFETTIFTSNITIIIAGVVLAIVLSVGLGGRTIMSNVLARYYINQLFRVGDEVLLAGQKGKITKITPISVIIKSTKGEKIHVPNNKIINEGSILIKSHEE